MEETINVMVTNLRRAWSKPSSPFLAQVHVELKSAPREGRRKRWFAGEVTAGTAGVAQQAVLGLWEKMPRTSSYEMADVLRQRG